MQQSMTGYGSKILETGLYRVSVRIRSVNHRYLDAVVKMPDDVRHLEIAVRQHIGNRLTRGRIELRVDVENRRDREVRVAVNKSWIKALTQVSAELGREGLDLGSLQLRDLLRIPDAVRISAVTDREDPVLDELILAAVDGALDEVAISRGEEGSKLQIILLELLSKLADEVDEIGARQAEVRKELDERFRQRMAELSAEMTIPDESRVSHEIAMMIDRGDVREELDRLATHQAHFRETMAQKGAMGKKLDFIAQEVSRELTTLAAKCRNTSVVQRNVEAKLICEQIREQIQNIE